MYKATQLSDCARALVGAPASARVQEGWARSRGAPSHCWRHPRSYTTHSHHCLVFLQLSAFVTMQRGNTLTSFFHKTGFSYLLKIYTTQLFVNEPDTGLHVSGIWDTGLSFWRHCLSPVKRICVFKHSVMTNFNCAYPAIQRGQGSGFLSEGSSWLTACMSEQRRFWRDCADAQARLNLRCSHMR